MMNSTPVATLKTEVADVLASISGLAENGVDLYKPGRVYRMGGELTKQKKKGGLVKNFNYVFLFSDIIVFAETHSKKKNPYKYVSHMYIKDILLIDCDSKDKFSFELLHKTEKSKLRFTVKDRLNKILWKTAIEREIERVCPTASDGLGSGPESPRNSWSEGDLLSGYNGSLGSHSEFESDLDGSSCGDSPHSHYPLLNGADFSSVGSEDNDSSSYTEDTDDNRSDEDSTDFERDPNKEVGKVVTFDGIEIISHANLHTTLWWLINYGDYNDPILIRTFLYSSNTFTNATDLFDNLMKIYNLVIPVPKAIPVRYSLCDTRKRVTYFLRIWLEHFFERDFYKNRILFENLMSFFSELNENGQKQDANLLKLIIIRVNKPKLIKKGMNHFAHMNASNQPHAPNSKLSSKSSQHSALAAMPPSMGTSDQKFLDWNVAAVAEQFTLIEFALFKAVDLKEISNQAWKSEQPKRTALNVVNIFNRFDLVSQWAATEVVMAQQQKQRVSIIEKLILLAQKCFELRNYNSLMEIVAGLNRGSVQRMKKAWEAVSHTSKDTFRSLNSFVDSVQNYKNYREILRKSVPPCLPYFGIFLRDLTFTDVGNDSKCGDFINLEKIYMTSRILKEIQVFQKTSYTFDEDDVLQPSLRRLLAMPEEMLYKHSQSVEPTLSLTTSI